MNEKINAVIETTRPILAALDSLPQDDAQKDAFFLGCKLDRVQQQREECSSNQLTRDRFLSVITESDAVNQIMEIAATATMKYNKYIAENIDDKQ